MYHFVIALYYNINSFIKEIELRMNNENKEDIKKAFRSVDIDHNNKKMYFL